MYYKVNVGTWGWRAEEFSSDGASLNWSRFQTQRTVRYDVQDKAPYQNEAKSLVFILPNEGFPYRYVMFRTENVEIIGVDIDPELYY